MCINLYAMDKPFTDKQKTQAHIHIHMHTNTHAHI